MENTPAPAADSASAARDTFTGHCLCGGVRYEVRGPLNDIQVCHCSMCRRAYGGPLATIMPVRTERFRLLAGEDLLSAYEATPGKQRVSCARCHAPIYSRRDADPDWLRLRAGLLDEPLPARPAVDFYADSAPGWWPVTGSRPRYAGNMPSGVKNGLEPPAGEP